MDFFLLMEDFNAGLHFIGKYSLKARLKIIMDR